MGKKIAGKAKPARRRYHVVLASVQSSPSVWQKCYLKLVKVRSNTTSTDFITAVIAVLSADGYAVKVTPKRTEH